MRSSALLRGNLTVGAAALLLSAAVGAVWFLVWFWAGALVIWLVWPTGKGLLSWLVPPFVIPVLYLPFFAKWVQFRVTNDAKGAQATLLVGILGAVIAAWWLLVYFGCSA